MHFLYCPSCGRKLIDKEIGDEGLVPFCESCSKPLWDMFQTNVICAVVNESDEVALIKQSYVYTDYRVCIAGVIKMGEDAEETAIREIKEEIGLDVLELSFVKSFYYEKKGMLMLGFKAKVKKTEFSLSNEVDDAKWIPFSDALSELREGSIAYNLVKTVIEKN